MERRFIALNCDLIHPRRRGDFTTRRLYEGAEQNVNYFDPWFPTKKGGFSCEILKRRMKFA